MQPGGASQNSTEGSSSGGHLEFREVDCNWEYHNGNEDGDWNLNDRYPNASADSRGEILYLAKANMLNEEGA